MAFKVLAVLCLVSAASAAPQQLVRTIHAAPAIHALPVATTHTVAHAAPAVVRVSQPVFRTAAYAAPAVEEVIEEEDDIEPATYTYGFTVSDPETGDSKAKEETADHGIISGSYSVAQPDGRLRLVTYTASKEDGFQAHVTYDGEDGPPSIPFDVVEEDAPAAVTAARTTTTVQAAPATTVVRTATPVFHAPADTVVRTAAAPATVFHAAPAVHAVHALPTTRVVSSNAQHVVHAQPTLVRTVPAAATHVIHA